MKFVGDIGFFEEEVEVRPGVYRPKIIEMRYTGDVILNYRNYRERSDSQNENITMNNRISIVANQYMLQHLNCIRYVWWSGARWRVTSVSIEHPRVILEIGEQYNVKNAPETTGGTGKYTWR